MQNLKKSLYLVPLIFSLVACGGASDPVVVESPLIPELDEFHLVDSYGETTDTAIGLGLEMSLNPEENDGAFEIYWYANTFYDYWATVVINDSPEMEGGVLLSSEICGADYYCDLEGLQLCTYSLESTMGCGEDPGAAEDNAASIDSLLNNLPEYLYINLEVCDLEGANCQVLSNPVTVY